MDEPESTPEAPDDHAASKAAPPFESPFERAARISATPGEKRDDRTWYSGDKGRKSSRSPQDLDLDPRWLHALEDHLGSAESILIRVRRGASKFVDLFSQAVIYVDGEQGREAAPRIGRDIWDACVRHASRHGPILDFQLVIIGKGKGESSELACVSIRISLLESAGSEYEDDAADPTALRSLVSHTSGMLREARLDKAEHREERGAMIKVIMSLLEALPAALDNVGTMIERASRLHDAGAEKLMHLIEHEVDRERARFEAEFNVAKIDAIANGIKVASEIVSGEAGAAFLQWLATSQGSDEKPPETVQDAAADLGKSITLAQARDLGIDGDAIDLEKSLQAAADAPDEITALPSISVALSIAGKHAAMLAGLTPRQKLLLGFLRGRVSASQAPRD